MHYNATTATKLATCALAIGLALGGAFGCRGWTEEDTPPWLDDGGLPNAGAESEAAPTAGASGSAAGSGAEGEANGAAGTAGAPGSAGDAGAPEAGSTAAVRRTPDR